MLGLLNCMQSICAHSLNTRTFMQPQLIERTGLTGKADHLVQAAEQVSPANSHTQSPGLRQRSGHSLRESQKLPSRRSTPQGIAAEEVGEILDEMLDPSHTAGVIPVAPAVRPPATSSRPSANASREPSPRHSRRPGIRIRQRQLSPDPPGIRSTVSLISRIHLCSTKLLTSGLQGDLVLQTAT